MKTKTVLFVISLCVLGVLALAFFGTQSKKTRAFYYGDAALNVLVADDAIERARGLSGISLEELQADGMVFLFNDQKERTFWMKGMKFDLDVIWINDGRVVKIDRNVKAPKRGEDPARMRSTPMQVDTVLELPAGGADQWGFLLSTSVRGFR